MSQDDIGTKEKETREGLLPHTCLRSDFGSLESADGFACCQCSVSFELCDLSYNWSDFSTPKADKCSEAFGGLEARIASLES